VKTANRKPKLNKKPSRGLKILMKQQLKGLKKLLIAASGPTKRKDQWWKTPQALRASWLMSFSTSNYKPHQGAQEKARRMRQMANGTHGYPPKQWHANANYPV